jgi:hypothetical protein
MADKKNTMDDLDAEIKISKAETNIVPFSVRAGIHIPKPLDWQAFQRNCVILFREELRDPHTQEYGRSGQNQHGIDILGHRGGDPPLPTSARAHAQMYSPRRSRRKSAAREGAQERQYFGPRGASEFLSLCSP